MAKFWAFIKDYWFGMLTGFILLVGFLFFLLVLLSPRQDLKKRGFIPCTETLAQNILGCPVETKYRCIFGEIMQNSWCDIKVIGRGVKLWVSGQQSAPWSNYIFRPETSEAAAAGDELDAEFYQEGSHPELDFLKLQQLSDIIEKQNADIKKRQLENKQEVSQPQQPEKEKNE